MVNGLPKDGKTKISPVQIRMGTRHELEHTSDPKKAKKIALDHLKEAPKYYTYLNKMESQMQKDKKKR
jgi:hypothetical protein